ncbi:nucleotidyltransferase domain-containing protein [Tumebacillus sp. DT12]|uniref:Nucleotidyltransferase domain-containing protein n=1 Tax=Tumebacillus lacus TaxID=2995335 RepID=A0ABT3X551_9BACL|nr:nucleotidyltransferase domain-containing protein [Tumebacillus lacus]MCX7572028.1 nucleotidyltransferase domain-containing protein [Tumebacillus lacus]
MIQFSVLGETYRLATDIEAICLFGSVARGDNDENSDIDLLIVVEDCDEQSLIDYKAKIIEELNVPYHWVSLYRKSSIIDMHRYGSYFLWHVKTEGKILFSKNGFLEKVFTDLPPYNKTRENLTDYLEVCRDIESSLERDSLTLGYDLSILASIARNTCIAISYLFGELDFGRITCVEKCLKFLGAQFPFSLGEYEELYKYRIMETRGYGVVTHISDIDKELYVREWLLKIESLLNVALKIEKERGVGNDDQR